MTLYLNRREKAVWTAFNLLLLAVPLVVTTVDRVEYGRTKFKHLLTGCTGPFEDISDETHSPYNGGYGSEHRWVRCRGCGLKAWLPEEVLNEESSA